MGSMISIGLKNIKNPSNGHLLVSGLAYVRFLYTAPTRLRRICLISLIFWAKIPYSNTIRIFLP